MANTKFKIQEGSNQNPGFLNGKNQAPPQTKAIIQAPLKPRQIKPTTKLNQRRQLPLKWRT
jgi:hypothetical protein